VHSLHDEASGLGLDRWRRTSMKNLPGVEVVDDCDVVPATDESARQTLDPDGVPPEVIWRIESRHHSET